MFLTGVGRLGRDIEVRTTANGTAVAGLSLAFEYGQRDAQGQRPTQWIDATLWGEQVQRLEKHLIRGTVLTVCLRDPHIEAFTRRDGTPGTKLAATIQSLEFTPRQREREATATAPGNAAQPKPPTARANPGGATAKPEYDDDIPF